MQWPLVSRKKSELRFHIVTEELRAEVEQAELQYEMLKLAHETTTAEYAQVQAEYAQIQNATEAALTYIEKLWNKMSVKDVNGVFDLVLDDALPLLKEHSLKYSDVDVEEAKANVAAGVSANRP